MTDLPVSLLCASAVLLTSPAFRTWKWMDIGTCALALGLALAAKHSAPVFLIIIFLTGCVRALFVRSPAVQTSRLWRFGMVWVVVLGALTILCGRAINFDTRRVTRRARCSIARWPTRSRMCSRRFIEPSLPRRVPELGYQLTRSRRTRFA